VRVSEHICKNTESPDHPLAAAARMRASLALPTDAQAAHPEVSSKNEKRIARKGEGNSVPKIDEKVPTAQVKKVTKAHTDMTEYAADTTDDEKIEKMLSLTETGNFAFITSLLSVLDRKTIPQIKPEKRFRQ
jgi:hypothetical protein